MTEPFSVEIVAGIGPISGEWHPSEATGFAAWFVGVVMLVVVSSKCAKILDGTTKSTRYEELVRKHHSVIIETWPLERRYPELL